MSYPNVATISPSSEIKKVETNTNLNDLKNSSTFMTKVSSCIDFISSKLVTAYFSDRNSPKAAPAQLVARLVFVGSLIFVKS